MDKLLNLLNKVKKWAVASIIMTIVAYLAAKWKLGAEEVTMIGSLCTIIFGAASYEGQLSAMKASQKSIPSNEI